MGGVTNSKVLSDFHLTSVQESPPMVTVMVEVTGPKKSPVACNVCPPFVVMSPSIFVILGTGKNNLAGLAWLAE